MCHVFPFSGTVSIVTLSVLSIQRCLSLSHPKRSKMMSFKSVGFIIATIWAYTMLVALPPWFGWGQFVPETSGMT